jgi:hypothetical protein
MDWINGLLGFNDSSPYSGGAMAPNSGTLPLSTPVNTSGGNTNTSGSWFSSFIQGLSGLGTTAANAYATIRGAKASNSTTPTATPASSMSTWLPIALIGGGLLIVVLLLFRRG